MSEQTIIPTALPPQESVCLTLTIEGEKIVKAVVGAGYNHRGLEKAAENRTYLQNIYLIERACGIFSHTHSLTYCQAVEELLGLRIPRRAAYIRCLMAELERLQSHLLWLGTIGQQIGFETLFMYAFYDREQVLDILALISGNRVNYSINTIGGIRRDLEAQDQDQIRYMLQYLEERLKYYLQLALTEQTLSLRLAGAGKLSKPDALRLGVVGPLARAAGISSDIRLDDPYAAYDEIPLQIITDNSADALGRLLVRLKEMLESSKIIHFCLDHLPADGLAVKAPREIPAHETLSRTEAPSGEEIHYLRANGTEMPDRVRIRTAAKANWYALTQMLEGGYLADLPIVFAEVDPFYSYAEQRIMLSRAADGSNDIWDWQRLCEYSAGWQQKR